VSRTREQAVAAGLGAPAQPVARRTRRVFERALGADPGDVSLHTGTAAAEAAAALGADAFTVGKHVVVGKTRLDEAVLGHELVHTLQQPDAVPSGRVPDASTGAEREAAAIASRVSGGLTAARPAQRTGLSVARLASGTGADWPNWVGIRPLTPQQNQLIDMIERRRAAATTRTALRFQGSPGSAYVSGYAYGGRPGTLAPNAPRYLQIAMKEYWALEAGVGGVDTWDTPSAQRHANFSLGPGMLNVNAASVMRKWIEADADVELYLLYYAGVWVTPANEFRVVVGRDDIRGGDEALLFLDDPQILSLIIDLAESPHSGSLDRAEQDWITQHELRTIPAQAATWDDAAIAVCLHIQHGAPAYSWVDPRNRAAYVATNGDPLEIARVFAAVTARLGIFARLGSRTTGPILVTRQWGELVYDVFGKWGVGGGKPGYVQQAIDTAGIRVSGTRAELAASIPAGDVLYQTGATGKDTVTAIDIGQP
jgi:hypothetical protein